ncbi:hypothetical protein I302_103398 [Kwoniella bestiolae CBS 10118]|uniref:Uncharacterized protein n=1 Tax=Kwoniella bestiolae CBS 10118 TaxID=1296100 RepID=A0A1B9G8A5_9TREE|nr:hypothetical protein I302_02098 [Kwoniella bestiolae CBS 10118]OCF27258.1 hypothetical protein I302_02098 [Kwoniella bestiolae CBS 10118]
MCFVPSTPSNITTDSRCCFESLTCAQTICAYQRSEIVQEEKNIWCNMDLRTNDWAYRQDNGTVCKQGGGGWCLSGFNTQQSSVGVKVMVSRGFWERTALVLLGLGILSRLVV